MCLLGEMKPRLQLELRKGDREVLESRRNSRTLPCLPLGIRHIRIQTHDYVRNGTTTLFAALDYATGKVLHRTATGHNHQEWLAFLRQIDRARDQLG